MQLHIFNQAPSHSSWQNALQAVTSGDIAIYIQDAAYAYQTAVDEQLLKQGVKRYLLAEEAQLRGVIVQAVDAINSQQFVEYSLAAQHCLSWY